MKIAQNTQEKLEAIESSGKSYIIAVFVFVLGIFAVIANFLLGLAVIAIAVFMILASKKRHIIIDKSAKTLSYSAKSIISKTNKQYNFTDIKNIELKSAVRSTLERSYSSSNFKTSRMKIAGQLILNLNSGETLQLAYDIKQKPIFKSVEKSGIPNQELGQQLAAAIGAPFVTHDQQSQPTQPTIQN